MCDYGVGIGETEAFGSGVVVGLGVVMVGMDLKHVLVKIIIDKELSENDLNSF